MNADGSGLRWLTDDPGIDIHPAWAPDGQSILWNSSRHSQNLSEPETFEVFTMAPDGSNRRQLTRGGVSTYASWSPDGRALLYRAQSSDGNSEIVIARSGAPDFNLSRHPAFDGWPSWHWMVAACCSRVRPKPGRRSSWSTPTALGLLQVTQPGRWTNPRWSPAGDRIVVTARSARGVRMYLLPAPGDTSTGGASPRDASGF